MPALPARQLCEVSDYNVSIAMRREMEPLLVKNKVNLFLCGHQHSCVRRDSIPPSAAHSRPQPLTAAHRR